MSCAGARFPFACAGDNRAVIARLGAVVTAVAFLGTGCGSGGGGEVAGGGGDKNSSAYQAAFEFCRPGVNALAVQYGVPATEKAVTEAIVDQVAVSANDEDDARRGCHDSLQKTGK